MTQYKNSSLAPSVNGGVALLLNAKEDWLVQGGHSQTPIIFQVAQATDLIALQIQNIMSKQRLYICIISITATVYTKANDHTCID